MTTSSAVRPTLTAPDPATVSPHHPSRHWIWLAAWPVTAVFVLSNAPTPLYVLWQRVMGFSAGTLTVIFASYIAGLIGALLVAGVVADRIGRKPVLLPALVLGVVAAGLFATATSVAMLVTARALTGIAVGATVSAGMAAVTDVAGPARKPLGALLASTAVVVGAGLGPLLAGVLSETTPWPTTAVFLLEIVLLGSALLVVLRMPLTRPAPSGARGAWVRVPSVPSANRQHLAAGIAVFAPAITATSFVLSLGPSLLAELLGSSNRIVAGGTAFVMFVVSTGVQFALRRLTVRGMLLTAALTSVTSMLTLIAAVHTASVVLLVGAALLAGAGQGLGQLGGLSVLSRHVPAHRLAEANAGLNTGGYLLAGTLPMAAGYLSDVVGLPTGTTIFGVVLILAALSGAAFVLTRRVLRPA